MPPAGLPDVGSRRRMHRRGTARQWPDQGDRAAGLRPDAARPRLLAAGGAAAAARRRCCRPPPRCWCRGRRTAPFARLAARLAAALAAAPPPRSACSAPCSAGRTASPRPTASPPPPRRMAAPCWCCPACGAGPAGRGPARPVRRRRLAAGLRRPGLGRGGRAGAAAGRRRRVRLRPGRAGHAGRRGAARLRPARPRRRPGARVPAPRPRRRWRQGGVEAVLLTGADVPARHGGARRQALVHAGRGRARATRAAGGALPVGPRAPAATRRCGRRRAPRRLMPGCTAALVLPALTPADLVAAWRSAAQRWLEEESAAGLPRRACGRCRG